MSKVKIIPELRFPEFKNDGEWVENSLEEVATFLKGKGISKADIVENGNLPCIRYGELYTHYNETISAIKSYTNSNINDLVLSEANDVIIPASGETQIDIATASCVIDNGIALGSDLNIIRSKINGVFLSYYLNNVKKKEIAQMAQGIAVVHLYPNQLKTLKIQIPYPKEQQKIASCLSSLDEIIATHSQKLNLLKDHKKGMMQNLFPHEGEKVPKYRFKEFENDGEWCETTLGDIGNFIGGGTPDTTKAEYWNGDIQWYTPTEVKEGKVGKSIRTITELGLKNSSAKLLPKGSLLLTTRATIGDIAIADFECTTNQGFQSLVVKETEINTFWFYWIIRHKNELIKKSSGSTFPEIGKTEITKINALKPNKPEQQKIASCLSSLDALITAQAEKIEQLKLHKKGLMQGLFPKIEI